jgi:hypothetical protein
MPRLTEEEKAKHFRDDIARRVAMKEAKAQKAEEKRLEWVEAQNAKRLKKQEKRFHCKWCKEEFGGLNFIKEDHFASMIHSENRRKMMDKLRMAKSIIEYCKDIGNWEGNGEYCNLKQSIQLFKDGL